MTTPHPETITNSDLERLVSQYSQEAGSPTGVQIGLALERFRSQLVLTPEQIRMIDGALGVSKGKSPFLMAGL